MRAFFTLVTSDSSGRFFDGIDVASSRDGAFFRAVVHHEDERPAPEVLDQRAAAPTARPGPIAG